ncbi:NADPH-dependent F420 reductase [Aquabacter spiritensis]|uniref:Reduced coenzyme F420:NADP oxidoreductase n=1 Tax=Aquabacter spiritensis TaxID=933073 RepID=A0A4R3LWJ6_9HYPH|nr:NADPH-dependent F420 reductase [Aquabacter spiritensis]TCT05000.1 reduced coenzyme F420:NADP oxidoreductase [Aquabacter spiritensis]
MTLPQTIAVIGGSGALGGGIAARLALAGLCVVIGSRTAERAEAAAEALRRETGCARVRGCANCDAAATGDLVIVAVPFASQDETLRAIAPNVAGKIVIDTTVPLLPPKVARVQLPREGSAAARAAAALGPDVRLVTAFHNVSAQKLRSGGPVGCDVLVFGDDTDARSSAVVLIEALGLRALHGGPLANSAAAEAMTSVLIAVNRRYGVAEGAGIRLTGIPEAVA